MAAVGRPLKYATPEEMQAAIDAYFADCDAKERPYTVTGLALALGFAERKSLIDYAERDGFLHTIKAAKAKVEEFLECRLLAPSATGTIFNLKNNFGWKDAVETQHTGPGGAQLDIRYTVIDPVNDKPAGS